jgi:serine/threonine protein kinase
MNILVKHVHRSSAELGYMQVKAADFGASKVKELTCGSSSLTLGMGTTRWVAPELFSNTSQRFNSDHVNATNYDPSSSRTGIILLKYLFKCNVYSFGMVCHEILKGDVPFAYISPGNVYAK